MLSVAAFGEAPRRVQEVALEAGWNAVHLEVQPLDDAPATVFAGLPIDKVATLFESPVTNQFVTNPDVNLQSSSGWGVWYASELPEAFLKSLDAINGNRAYLVHARSACRLSIEGEVVANETRWRSDAYNLVGFPVVSPGGPTFEQFFSGSAAHADQPIYRLVKGRWKKVLEPSAESIRSGEAFWIYCDGPSDYQGPLRVETDSHQGLVLGSKEADLVLRNDCSFPVTATVHHLSSEGPPVPISVVVRAIGEPGAPVTWSSTPMPAGAWEQSLPPLEAGSALTMPLRARREAMSRSRQDSLLKVTTDVGTVSWLPVSAFRADLSE